MDAEEASVNTDPPRAVGDPNLLTADSITGESPLDVSEYQIVLFYLEVFGQIRQFTRARGIRCRLT